MGLVYTECELANALWVHKHTNKHYMPVFDEWKGKVKLLEVNDDNYFGKHTFYKGTVPVLRPTFLDLYKEFGEQFRLRLRNDLSLKPIKEEVLYGE